MIRSNTKKSKIWKYFEQIDRDKTFTKAKCTLCNYSTYYYNENSILWKHLSQHKDQIIQLEADSKDSNPSVSSHNCTEETENAATIIEAVDTTASTFFYDYKTKIMRHAELLFQTPTIEKDFPNSIRAFVNHIRTHLGLLKLLNVPVDT